MDDDFKIIEQDEKFDLCYGCETFQINEEHIEALRSGKKLYGTINCGEYAIVIHM